MSVLDPRSPVDDLRRMYEEIREIGRRLDLLESPSGTQAFRTVAKLETAIDAAVLPVMVRNYEQPAAILPTASDFAIANTVVPDGYSRAIVQATAVASLRSNAAAGVTGGLIVACTITSSSAYTTWNDVAGQQYGFAAAPNTAILTGLVAGATISVRARVSFPQAFTLGRASVDGSILFLR
ncbi:hypothetical protein FVP74_09360 [Microbacterium saccharophilum]|uniref:Uncharacterized protein n=1 Tax=Microbacterium saccharophilum TaxID=1213358 RepID=A0A5C8HZ10_9MICO|nr:hypothetical protein [Microbacterium saccharophilum]TXK11526.1 hypothetical protein FVP74_09360 [Microbacterium saccharophilum]GEP49080.1 hypothetical protein MSA03_25880 [Microbacterium saccharophilum]